MKQNKAEILYIEDEEELRMLFNELTPNHDNIKIILLSESFTLRNEIYINQPVLIKIENKKTGLLYVNDSILNNNTLLNI